MPSGSGSGDAQITGLQFLSTGIWAENIYHLVTDSTPRGAYGTGWTLQDGDNGPFGVKAGQKLKFTSLEFTISDPVPSTTCHAQGTGFPSVELTSAGGGKFVYSGTPVEANGVLSNETKFIPAHAINWVVTSTATGSMSAGTTTNAIYVTLSDPQNSGVYPIRTVVHLAVAAGGATAANGLAFAKTWAMFSKDGDGDEPADTKTWDGVNLHYYKAGTSFAENATTINGLLSNTNKTGQCEAWTELLQNALKLNGVDSDEVQIVDNFTTSNNQPQPATDYGFIVGNWTAVPNPQNYAWTMRWPGTAKDMTLPNPPTGGVYFELTSVQGVKGQNEPTPSQKFFTTHVVLNIGTTYYDPSYGKAYSGIDQFMDILGGYVYGFWPLFWPGIGTRLTGFAYPSVNYLEGDADITIGNGNPGQKPVKFD